MIEIKKNGQVVDNSRDVFISTEMFKDNTNITNVDLGNHRFENSNASMAFANCSNLVSVTNIINDSLNVEGMFYNCSSLENSVNLPNNINGKTYYANGILYKGYSTKFSVDLYSGEKIDSYYINPDNSIKTVYYFNNSGNFQSLGTASEIYDDHILFPVSGSTDYINVYADRNEKIDSVNPNESEIYGLYENCSNIIEGKIISDNISDVRYSFRNCYNLINAEINCSNIDSLESTFANCSNLENVKIISNNLSKMDKIFYNFKNLKNIVLNTPKLKSLNQTFYGCSNLTDAPEMPNSVTNMYQTFSSCYNLINISSIPNSVTNMYQTFYYCNNLVNIPEIPNSVKDLDRTFERCFNITDVSIISDNVTNMKYTFQYCNNLSSVNVIVNNNVNMYWAFYNCSNLTDVYINIDNIVNSDSIFNYSNNISNLYLESKMTNNTSIINNFMNTNASKVTLKLDNIIEMNNTFNGKTNLVEADIFSNSITNMPFTFNGCSNLVTVSSIPNTVTKLSSTFAYCSNLVNAPEIPNSVTYMGSTFSGCSNLVNAPEIPNSVTTMYFTFNGCRNLVNAPEIPNSVTNMSTAFGYCSNLVNAPEIPNTVTNMFNTFSNCFKLINIGQIPDSVIDMNYTFSGCSNLVNAPVIPNSVADLRYTFTSCSNLVNAPVIPNSVTNMISTFYSCPNLVNIPELPNSIINMSGTFTTCRNLVNAPTIPGSVTNMYQTFHSCSNLVNAPEIPNSVINLVNTFYYCNNLVNVPKIGNSVTNMYYTFYYCNKVNNVIITSEIVANARYCFYGTTLSKNVYIPFKYDNGVNTTTYNSFVNAGYSISSRVNGALLKDTASYVTFNITPNEGTSIYLNNKLISTRTRLIKGNNGYVIKNSSYPTFIGIINNDTICQEYIIEKNLNNLVSHTIEFNIGVSGLDVSFYIGKTVLKAEENNGVYTINLCSDDEIEIAYEINGGETYRLIEDTLTFNNEDITRNITLEQVTWVSWTRPNLTADGVLGQDYFAVSAEGSNAYKAVDSSNTWSSYWRSKDSANATYTMYSDYPIKISNMILTYYNSSMYIPTSTTKVKVSNNGIDWIDVTTSGSISSNVETINLTLDKAYNYYKLYFGKTTQTYYSIELQNIAITAKRIKESDVVVTFNNNAENATYTYKALNTTLQETGNILTIEKGTTVNYTIKAEGYNTLYGSVKPNGNMTVNVHMDDLTVVENDYVYPFDENHGGKYATNLLGNEKFRIDDNKRMVVNSYLSSGSYYDSAIFGYMTFTTPSISSTLSIEYMVENTYAESISYGIYLGYKPITYVDMYTIEDGSSPISDGGSYIERGSTSSSVSLRTVTRNLTPDTTYYLTFIIGSTSSTQKYSMGIKEVKFKTKE